MECYNCNTGSYRNGNLCPHEKAVDISALSYSRRLHKGAILKYGGICIGCGETEVGFLTIEHRNGGGGDEIKTRFGNQPEKFYRWLRDHNIREDITILCYNCNCSKSYLRIR